MFLYTLISTLLIYNMAYPASMYNTDEIYTALKAYDIKKNCGIKLVMI